MSMHPNPNISEAIILISSPETVPPPDICQSLGSQGIMEENCTDQMFKTVTVPTKYRLEQNQSLCEVWISASSVDDGIVADYLHLEGSKVSNISRSKHRYTEAATAQFLMGPESNLVYL